MSEIDDTPRNYSGALLGAIAIALLCAIVSLVWAWNLSSRLSAQQAELADARQRNVQLAADLRETDARLRVTADELGKSLGLTQKQLDTRAQQLLAREAAEEAANKRLASAQQQTAQQVNAVASDVTSVKSDVGGVRTDLGKTQTDVQNAMAQLTSMKGDLGQQSGLIAKTHDELVLLEHKGDRNYYEFTLDKNRRKPVGTISLELKKADPKHNRFTLLVISDDRTVEKKDRNIDEPLQFYSGKEPALFEIVVNSINGKNHISGYLSTPKTAPAPPVAQ
jgi:F0F1-type ATP synthase membrane subunit b/b'